MILLEKVEKSNSSHNSVSGCSCQDLLPLCCCSRLRPKLGKKLEQLAFRKGQLKNKCASLQRHFLLLPSITVQPCTLTFSLLCTGTLPIYPSAPRRRSACSLSPFVKVRNMRWEKTLYSYILNMWKTWKQAIFCIFFFLCTLGPSLWVCKMGYNRRVGLLRGFCHNDSVQKTVRVHQGYNEPQPWLWHFFSNWLNSGANTEHKVGAAKI